MSTKKKPNLEKSITALEDIVHQMESNQLPLEESLALFEKGIGLLKQSQATLNDAEQKIKILTQNQLVDFE